MLIAWAFVGVLYILQSSASSWLFTIGLFWEKVFGLCTFVLILAFPTGRLDRPAKIVLLVGVVGVLVSSTAIQLLLPQLGAGGSISSCQSLCPRNEIAVTSDPALAADVFELFRYAVLALALAVAGLIVHRFFAGTPPRRRALAVGTPVALLFLVCEILYQLLGIVGAEDSALYDIVSWVFVAARAGVWYGFVFALIAAELFAARTMKRMVEESLHRPSRHELEVMLREPLGDPRLRLHFLDQSAEAAAEFRAIEAGPGRELTVVRRDSTPAVAIDHDAQLSDDPELLNVAGAVALLAAENAQLDASWRSALQELRESRARIVKAGDAERRKIEQNLHDGVQQRLIRTRIDLELARESALSNPQRLNTRLQQIGGSIEETLDELREVAHGVYPPVLVDWGLDVCTQAHPSPRRRLAHHRRRPRQSPAAGDRVRRLLLLSGSDPEREQARRTGGQDHRYGLPTRKRTELSSQRRRPRLRSLRRRRRRRTAEHARPHRRTRRSAHDHRLARQRREDRRDRPPADRQPVVMCVLDADQATST